MMRRWRLLLAWLVLILPAAPAYATWVYESTKDSYCNPGAVTVASCATAADVVAGEIVLGGIGLNGTSRTINSIGVTSGSTGTGTCTLYNNPTDTTSPTRRGALYACVITGGGTFSVDITLSGNQGITILQDVYSGESTTVDLTRMNPEDDPGTGADDMNSTTGTPSMDGSLIWGFCWVSGGSPTLTAGTSPNTFTLRGSGSSSGVRLITEEFIQTTAASIETTCGTSVDGTNGTITGMIVVQPLAGGGGDPTFGFYKRRP